MNKREIGGIYEKKAAVYLEKQGYEILQLNYHAGRLGEIDIIAMSPDETLVFVECKARSGYTYGGPLSAITPKKKMQIAKAALYYYGEKQLPMTKNCRFDVCGFYPDGRMQYIENAFPMPHMGGF